MCDAHEQQKMDDEETIDYQPIIEDGSIEGVFEIVAAANTKLFLHQVTAGCVLFCPGCHCDWNLLARFSDVVRTFIFCADGGNDQAEKALSLDNCPSRLRELFLRHGEGYLSASDQFPAMPDGIGGAYAHFTRNIEVPRNRPTWQNHPIVSRHLMAVSISGDPATVYNTLFTRPKVAPAYVSLRHCGWQNPMRETLVQAGPAQPQYLIANWPGVYAPWTRRWREIRTWEGASVFVRRTDPPNNCGNHVIELPQRENLEVINTALTPATINGAGGVLISLEDYLKYSWHQPDLRIFIDSTNLLAVAEIEAYDDRVERLALHGCSVCEALPRLAEACWGVSITRFTAVR